MTGDEDRDEARASCRRAEPIEHFVGDYRFLSNFFAAGVELDGVIYPSTEHAFQAAKTIDPAERAMVCSCRSPAEAKKAGRRVAMRADWLRVRVGVMEALVRQKFTRNLGLASLLLQTGDAELVEGNHWEDRFWGVCRGEGENWLGRILMKVRAELVEACHGRGS